MPINAEAQQSLLRWIQSFSDIIVEHSQTYQIQCPEKVHNFSDVCDGIFLSYLMHTIDPDYIQIDSINLNPSDSTMKLCNITKLVDALESYYRDELGQTCTAIQIVDIDAIARIGDVDEVCKLIELVLGCAIQCPKKSNYIHPIMQMDAKIQQELMLLIEDLMCRFQMTSPNRNESASNRKHSTSFSYSLQGDEDLNPEHMQHMLQVSTEKVSASEIKILDLERDKRRLLERIEYLTKEKQANSEKFARLEEEKGTLLQVRQNNVTRDNKRIQHLVESEVHAITIELEAKKEELQRVKEESNERLAMLENEVRRQADELDISRSKSAQLAKMEVSVAKYKTKLEEMSALRTQVKDLETHNAQYLEKVLDLESTIKTMPTLKALVEKYKNQVVELETTSVEASSNLQIRDQKIRRLQDELEGVIGGKEFLESQVEELRAQILNMEHRKEGRLEEREVDDRSNVGSAHDILGLNSSSSMREKLYRLERENTELRSGSPNAEQIHLQNELELAIKAKESMQMSIFQLKKQNEELLEEIEQISTKRSKLFIDPEATTVMMNAQGRRNEICGISDPNKLYATSQAAGIVEYEAKILKLQADLEKVDSMRATVQELTNRLKDKETTINDLLEQRTKLETYTQKTLHAVQTKYMVTISKHRDKLNEKEERIDFLEKRLKQMRASYSREQALMMSSFYEIGIEMQRRAMMPQFNPSSSSTTFQPTSWLSSKRTEERAKRRNI